MPSVDPDPGSGITPVPLAFGAMNLGVLDTEPDTTSSNKGDFYYNLTTGLVRMFNGTTWQDLSVFTVAARKTASNTFTTTQIIATGNDGNTGLRISQNSATQSGDLLQLTASNGTTILAKFNASGQLTTIIDGGSA